MAGNAPCAETPAWMRCKATILSAQSRLTADQGQRCIRAFFNSARPHNLEVMQGELW
jgi:hypothetical protein